MKQTVISASILCLLGGTPGFSQAIVSNAASGISPSRAIQRKNLLGSFKEDEIIESGQPYRFELPPVAGSALDVDNQLILEFPAGTESVWIEFFHVEDDPADPPQYPEDFDLYVGINRRVEFDGEPPAPVIADYYLWTYRGYEELGLWAPNLPAEGGEIYMALVERRRQEGVCDISLNAQLTALGFYEKLGFVPVGECFLEAGCPHLAMVLKTPS
jgi:hypothetical protein